MKFKERRGIVSISIALLIFLLASLSTLLISGVMREVVEVENKIQDSLGSSMSRLLMISNSNIWTKFLTDNGGVWDSIQYDYLTTGGTVTTLTLSNYVKINFGNSERVINYTVNSSTTQHSKIDRYIKVNMSVFINGQESQFGGSFDFGWPGL